MSPCLTDTYSLLIGSKVKCVCTRDKNASIIDSSDFV